MVNSLNSVQLSEGAQRILDKWEADRVAGRYNLARTRNQGLEQDTLIKSNNKQSADGKNDGKISLKEKAFNFYKGLTAPIYTMLESPSNFLLTLGGIGACAGLIAVTGGAATPFLIGAGILGGGLTIGKGILTQANAKNDEKAQEAWQNIGTGTFTLGVSALGLKTALKGNNTQNTQISGTVQNSLNYFKNFFNNAKQKVSGFASKFSKNSVKGAGAATEAEETVNNTSNEGLKGFFYNLKSKIFSSKENSSNAQGKTNVEQNAASKQNNDVIKIKDEDIEIINPEAKTTSTKQYKDEDIIDAEFTEIKNNSSKLPSESEKN